MSVTALVFQKAQTIFLPNLHQGDYSGLMVRFPDASDKAAIKNINAFDFSLAFHP